MIYTVTLNPSLDYIVTVNDFQLGITNRTNGELILPGGKGINVSTVLGNLGIESTALGFVAGFTGNEIERRMSDVGVTADFIHIDQGMSRINLKLQNIEGTEINGQGPDISAAKLEELMEKLEKLQPGDILCLAGSIPSSMPDDIYEKIIGRLWEKQIEIVVDATGELLTKVLKYKPFLIKPNNHELGEIFNVTLKTRDDVVPYGKKLQEQGSRNVLISLAGQGAVLIDENGCIHQSPAPKGKLVNGVGAGDSMVAGFLAGYMANKDYEHAFFMGVATGSASAFSKHLATKEEAEAVYSKIIGGDKV